MTAEIAIINRSAVALAADSAMTVKVGGTEKIYDSADKLFELSDRDPVAIMIFNSMDFMEVPLDVIIKEYRSTKYCRSNDRLLDFAEDFFDYLVKEVGANSEIADRHVIKILTKAFGPIRREFELSVARELISRDDVDSVDVYRLFVEMVEEYKKKYESAEIADCFGNTKPATLVKHHENAVNSAIQEIFKGMSLDDKDLHILFDLASMILSRDVYSDNSTGFVFAGFGKKDMFPTLVAFETDGIIGGHLKRKRTYFVDIDRNGPKADVVPFAQREMVDRFIYGIDAEFEKAIEAYIEKTIRQFGISIISSVIKRPASRRKKLLSISDDFVEKSMGKFGSASKDIRNYFGQQLMNMVLFMPKQELANMAESLVNLTSTKRKVSAETETVGGPIDVAVISRSEGFVWVKRKHYFDADLNPRFFHRKFGRESSTSGGKHGR